MYQTLSDEEEKKLEKAATDLLNAGCGQSIDQIKETLYSVMMTYRDHDSAEKVIYQVGDGWTSLHGADYVPPVDLPTLNELARDFHNAMVDLIVAVSAGLEPIFKKMTESIRQIMDDPAFQKFMQDIEAAESAAKAKKPIRQPIAPDPRMSRGKGGKMRWRRR